MTTSVPLVSYSVTVLTSSSYSYSVAISIAKEPDLVMVMRSEVRGDLSDKEAGATVVHCVWVLVA